MKISRVTITGADDKINPYELADLSMKYPFVEWGILFSKDRMGKPRYPSSKWVQHLSEVAEFSNMNLSAHICGRWARDMMAGELTFCHSNSWALPIFQRIQVNGPIDKLDTFNFASKVGHLFKNFIFQIKKESDEGVIASFSIQSACAMTVHGLYDKSGGHGKLPEKYSPPMQDTFCGYAGGLGPSNLREQINLMAGVAKGYCIWIDMEGNVRDLKDDFDLDKVETCLKIAKDSGYIKEWGVKTDWSKVSDQDLESIQHYLHTMVSKNMSHCCKRDFVMKRIVEEELNKRGVEWKTGYELDFLMGDPYAQEYFIKKEK